MYLKMITYADGASAKMHNKRVQFKELDDGSFILVFEYISKTPDDYAFHHLVKKGRLVQDSMRMSRETLEALVISYVKYRESKGERLNFTPFNEI